MEGATFTPLNVGTDDELLAGVVQGRDVYMVGPSTSEYVGGDIFHSANDGDTWSKVTLKNFDPFGIAASGDDVYAVGRYGQFARSTDKGATWTMVSESTRCGDVSGLVVQNARIDVLCGSGRLNTSTNRGESFAMKPLLAELELLFPDAHGGLYAASDRGFPQLLHYF